MNLIIRVVSESRQMKRKRGAVKRKKQEEDNQDNSMPDIAAKEFNGGHGLKTSLMAGFEKILYGKSCIYVFFFVRFFSRASRWIQTPMIMVKKE